ncbi:MAG: hypothetical protein ACR2P7_03120 [bacterium]
MNTEIEADPYDGIGIEIKTSPYDDLELTFYGDDSVKTISGSHITNSMVVFDKIKDEIRIHCNFGDYFAFPMSDKRNKKAMSQLKNFWEYRIIYVAVAKMKPRAHRVHGHREEHS